MSTTPIRDLETFANPNPERNYEIAITVPEFTCLCPKTGQPDFAIFRIRYVPEALCVELKALKLYFWSFRDEGHFHEACTNQVLEDLVRCTAPRAMEVEAVFNIRGGVTTRVTVHHGDRSLLGSVPQLNGLNPAVF
jgi:7-cyano-7-deazaguanine reductase